MPELPEVEAICRRLSPVLSGARILRVELRLPRILRAGEVAALVGRTVWGVSRRGKFILLEINSNLILYFHLGMTGTLLWEPAAETVDGYARAVIRTDKGALCFRDVRSLGGLWIADARRPPWIRLGPDPFDDEFTPTFLRERLAKRTAPIKVVLLDQGVVAGVGNIYASEILFGARIDPRVPAAGLGLAHCRRIVAATREVLAAAIAASGTTFRDFRLTDGREGAFQSFLQVYGKENQPCRRCPGKIHRLIQAGRSSYFCPRCQRAGRVRAAH